MIRLNQRRWIRASACALALAVLPALASAHPLGNFTVNHYAGIRVAADHADLDVVIDYAEIPTVAISRGLDTNGDGQADPAELLAARSTSCAKLASQLELTLNGAQLRLITRAAGLELLPGVAGLHTLRLVCEYRAVFTAPATAGAVVAFADNSAADRIGWREIVASGDGLQLSAATDASDAGLNPAALASGGVSQRLTHYPTDLLTRPLDERSLVVTVQPGGPALPSFSAPDATPLESAGGEAPSTRGGVVPGGVAGDLFGLINLHDLTLPVILLSLLGAAVLGGGHALTPGHGKTVMAAYLVGSHGTMRQAIVLGVSVTVSHTLGVIGLAVVVQVAADVIAPERIYPILAAISGGMVVAIGAWLLYGCMRRWRDQAGDPGHPASDAEHDHSHPHDHPHLHPHAGPRAPGMLGVISLGVAGGLVPSTSALVLLLAALAGGHAAYGLALAVAFGIGMAVVLSGIGIALARGRAMAARLPALPGIRRLSVGLPWLTATAVLVGGLLLTSQALVLRL